jgi:trehalose synthase
MWKGRAIVASAVGGISDQIDDGVNGVLVRDAEDLGACADAVSALLRDPERARKLGERPRARAGELFLGDRHLGQYGPLLERLAESGAPR